MPQIHSRQLTCGATLIVEPMSNVQSAAINWLLPLGSAIDPPGADGRAALLNEMIFRGAGSLDARQHSDALDMLGVQRSSDVSTYHIRLKATMIGEKLHDALPLIADMVQNPALPQGALEPARQLCLQSLDSLADDPQHLAMLKLRERFFPPPLNRHGYGQREVLEQATIDELREHWRDRCTPHGSIITIAGALDPDALADRLNDLLDGWTPHTGGQATHTDGQAGAHHEPTAADHAQRGYHHITQGTSQVHLAAAYEAPPERSDESMLERLGTYVLSGSTSARLFTEVRQKRSLCYSVGASYRPNRDFGMVSLYAGTTPNRAQETLDVMLSEIHRLTDGEADGMRGRAGVSRDEFHRAVVTLKSHLVMAGESTGARAFALANDQFRLGRPRTLEEVLDAIDHVSLDALNEYLARRVIDVFTIVSIGPEPLQVAAATAPGAA